MLFHRHWCRRVLADAFVRVLAVAFVDASDANVHRHRLPPSEEFRCGRVRNG